MERKRAILAFMTIFGLLALCGSALAGVYGGGNGTETEPYLIYTAEQMQEIGANPGDFGKHFKLMADINLGGYTGTQFNIIGNPYNTPHFTGVFDGNNHTISKFTYTSPDADFIGLFACVGSSGKVRNIVIHDVNVSGNWFTGGLVGMNFGKICDCDITGTISGNNSTGGLAGGNYGEISDCSVTAQAQGEDETGGLAGDNYGMISNCYAEGEVSGRDETGGLVGDNHGTILDCYANSNVDGNSVTGGLVGSNIGLIYDGLISWSYATGEVSGDNYSTGGLVGINTYGTVSYCYATGNVNGNNGTGGLVGCNIRSTISNCYSTASVLGNKNIGGLIGVNGDSTISNCYAAGVVDSNDDMGGLIGDDHDGTITDCFWDVESSGQSSSDGSEVGKTTTEMRKESTFTNWDFVDIWKICEDEDYPRLYWEKYGGGCGTVENPFLIRTSCQMQEIGANPNDWDKHFVMVNDINLSQFTGTQFNIIGNNEPFTGVFDGNGFTIYNFSYQAQKDIDIGLFAYVHSLDAVIKNVTLSEPNIDGDNGDCVGTLVGWFEDGQIENCRVINGNVSGAGSYMGGLIGYHLYGKVSNSSFIGRISGNNGIGGLVGFNTGIILNCYTSGTVSGADYIGGLVGYCWHPDYPVISNCYSNAEVSGANYIGGLVGWNGFDEMNPSVHPIISNCYANGSVIGKDFVGGLLGTNYGTVSNCFATGQVSGNNEVGGLVGANSNTVTASFWDSQIGGPDNGIGTPCTTQQMQTMSTFTDAGWDFIGDNKPSDDWVMPDGGGYPILWWQVETLPPLPEFSGGAGTEAEPYIVANADDLNDIGHNPRLMDKHFKLTNNIDLSNDSFYIISNAAYPFTGLLDGNGYKISNFHYTSTDAHYIGLFGRLNSSGRIKNLSVEDVNIYASNGKYVGALVGRNYSGSISDCYVTGNVSGEWSVGLLVGENAGELSKCYSVGSVSGYNGVGGLAGFNDDGSITKCYAQGAVTGYRAVGGLVGHNFYGSTDNCYSMSSCSGNRNIGGFAGINQGTIRKSYSTGSASGEFWVGGLVGRDDGGDVFESVWDVNTSGLTDSAGGTGKTTTEMQTKSTFTDAGWDFNTPIWKMCDGPDYPKLGWEECPEPASLLDVVSTMLDPNSLKNSNMKNALINKINAVLKMIDEGLYKGALGKLENDVLKKTDGCVKKGQPDKNDWIITCEEQEKIYPLVMETIEYVESLME